MLSAIYLKNVPKGLFLFFNLVPHLSYPATFNPYRINAFLSQYIVTALQTGMTVDDRSFWSAVLRLKPRPNLSSPPANKAERSDFLEN